LEKAQSTIGSFGESHSIDVDALQIENTDIKAAIATKGREYKSNKEEIKQRYEKQLEMMKKEKQALAQQHALQLKAIEDECRTVKHSMEHQYQAQLESKMSELSAKDALILRKSGTIQSLQVKLGQALGSASSKGNLSVFSPG
jgi:hypothetical protein